ncbi:MAG TPA: hypothetical protein PKK10_18060 [Woeseiaceae bacterium]|nr:hypothetical protein [Woeseiaceae bacterium]
MRGKRNPFVAPEGVPFLLFTLILGALALRFMGIAWALLPALLTVLLYLLFRDPSRVVPSVPLGVVSPVDGEILEISASTEDPFEGEGHRILIRIDSFGSYSARSPVEGHIMDLHTSDMEHAASYPKHALWLKTDEGDNVVLQFQGYRFGLPPKSLARYGERLGQGARCAYLRLARRAELLLPPGTQLMVAPGQRVLAGSVLLGKLPHH